MITTLDKYITTINILDSSKIKVGETLGSGGFGVVEEGNYKRCSMAIKKVSKEEYVKELKIMHRIRHPSFPLFYGIFHTKHFVNFAMERIRGSNLDIFAKKHDNYHLRLLMSINLAKSIEFLHRLGIIHRDIKPNNVMVSDSLELKLLDFGISKNTYNTKTTENPRSGTLIYLSPEYFPMPDSKGEIKVRINNKSDVWAFGLVLSEIFSSQKPWSQYIQFSNYEVMGFLYRRDKFPIPKTVPKEINEVIQLCTNYDLDLRCQVKEAKFRLMDVLYQELSKVGYRTFLENLFSAFNFSHGQSK